MTLDALTLVIKDLETGRVRGHALVCPNAGYASVLLLGQDRIDRRFASVAQFNAIKQEIGDGLEPGPLDRFTVLVKLIAGDSGAIVQYVNRMPLEAENRPGAAATALDAHLRAQLGPYLVQGS